MQKNQCLEKLNYQTWLVLFRMQFLVTRQCINDWTKLGNHGQCFHLPCSPIFVMVTTKEKKTRQSRFNDWTWLTKCRRISSHPETRLKWFLWTGHEGHLIWTWTKELFSERRQKISIKQQLKVNVSANLYEHKVNSKMFKNTFPELKKKQLKVKST